jgi:hypothetical protein
VNVHPFTDLIIRTWYEVQGTTVESVFDAPTTDPPAPSAEQVAVIASLVKDMLNIFLVAQGLDPITFDLIATPFDADGTGFDAVLEAAALEVNALTQTTTVTLTNATTSVTQTTALSVADKILSALTTTTGTGGASSGSLTSGVVPTDPAVQTALDGVLTSLQSFAEVVNSKGAALTATDLQPFFDVNYLDRGFAGPSLGAAQFATSLRGQTLNSFRVDSIVSYDDGSKVLCVIGIRSFTINGQTFERVVNNEGKGLCFKQGADLTWRFFGDQQIAHILANPAIENRSQALPDCPQCDGIIRFFLISAQAPEGTIASASVSGTDGLAGALVKNPTVFVDEVQPTPTTTLFIRTEHFDFPFSPPHQVTNFPPVGTVYTFTVTPVSGPVRTYDKTLQATTEEAIAITNLTSHNLADANLGSPLTVQWTLPTTFPVQQVELRGFVEAQGPNAQGQTETVGCGIQSSPSNLEPTATSATIIFPTTCGGHPLVPGAPPDKPFPAQLNVVVRGTHGEETRASWFFH